jgi:hypothetical protein
MAKYAYKDAAVRSRLVKTLNFMKKDGKPSAFTPLCVTRNRNSEYNSF